MKSRRYYAVTYAPARPQQKGGRAALADLRDFPLTRYPHWVLLTRIWETRHNVTAYDAAYLALAEALGAALVTRDRALAKVGGEVRVEVI